MIIENDRFVKPMEAQISQQQEMDICNFLKGCVFCWCKNKIDSSGNHEWFSLPAFMGKENYYWNDTPLIELWKYYSNQGLSDDEAVEKAKFDAGWLLKKVVLNARRSFHTRKQGANAREYQWDGNTNNDC